MNIEFSGEGKPFQFEPWRPEQGHVFSNGFAFDSETTRIDEKHPWITPAYVFGAAFDGNRGFFLTRANTSEFFRVHANLPIAMHNAPFDLAVLGTLDPGLGVYDWVENNLVHDTQLLHRLYLLGTEGHTGFGRGQSTLERCADYYLGMALPKTVVDSRGADVRTSYGQWLGRPSSDIEPIYLEYLAKDAVVTFQIIYEQCSRMQRLFAGTREDTFGFVSAEWLNTQVRQWGWQTHNIQLKAAIVLKQITANGLTTDVNQVSELQAGLEDVRREYLTACHRAGYIPGQGGCNKALQAIMRGLERQHSSVNFPRTPSDHYATSQDALQELEGVEPFVDALLGYKAVNALLSNFLVKMKPRRLHPSFDVLKTTGRTSSYGDINAQNLPRDDRVRACFVPSPGHVFIGADYRMLELAALGQVVVGQFGQRSVMAETINAGGDLHRIVAAQVTGKYKDDVTREERQKAKAINFGKPGGMGNEGLQRYARASYGVELSDEEVKELTNRWFELFPEMEDFLARDDSLGRGVAELFALTPASYFEATGRRTFLDHPANAGRETLPHPILGAMCLKVLRDPEPARGDGTPYAPEEVDFFWDAAATNLRTLPAQFHEAVRQRRAAPDLRRAVLRLADRGSVLTLTGRLRANATWCARHNTLFQGLASDGAKLALWGLWRAGYRIVNFVHDEVLVEVPADSDLASHARTIERLMIEAMRLVIPEVRIEVEFAAMRRWYKAAEAVWDDQGRLLPWEPPVEPSAPPIHSSSNPNALPGVCAPLP